MRAPSPPIISYEWGREGRKDPIISPDVILESTRKGKRSWLKRVKMAPT